jgi:NAD(P)-dependent dehydrogenase (short-subunit alcohol dehydrogenase family)
MQDVSGKVAFVTGAASGIGLGIAKALARAGARVMLCDIEEAALAWAVEALKPSNAEIAGVEADVSLEARIADGGGRDDRALRRRQHPRQQRRCRRRRAIWGVGRLAVGLDARRQFDVGNLGRRNLWTADREGRGAGTDRFDCLHRRSPLAHEYAYNVSKYGVVALSEGLRVDLVPRGIGVSVLCPDFIHTQINISHRNLPEPYGPS